jgi:hypothetical protein
MGVIRDKLIMDFQGTPAGEFIQVHADMHREMVENGFFAEPEPKEVEAAKKKPLKKKRTADADPK